MPLHRLSRRTAVFALIALAVLAAVNFLGGTMKSKFNTEGSQISSAGS